MFIEFEPGEKFIKRIDPQESDFVETFKDAGYLIKEDEVIVDIDTLPKESIKAMLKEFNINTQVVWTDRGAHLYFRKDGYVKSGTRVCALAFECEYKTSRSTKAITIRRNGITREIINKGVREPLSPIFKNSSKKYENLVGLAEGDGRNNKLRNHRIYLADCEGYEKYIRFINKDIFAEPMQDKELNDTILRNDFKVNGNNESDIAKQIINHYKIKLVGDKVFIFENKKYISDDLTIKRNIFSFLGSNAKTKTVDEIYKQIVLLAPQVDIDSGLPIVFKNGILQDDKFINIQSQEFTYYYVDLEYKKNVEVVPIVEEYLDMLTDGDKDYRDLLLEVLAHTMITDAEFKRALAKFFIFVGDGGNGKGTLLEIIRKILNSNNCSSLSIKQLSDDRYLPNIVGKLANLGDDIEGSTINDKDMKVLKNISTCDTTDIRRLYENSKSQIITTSLIFTSNHVIKSFEKGESYKRRVMWLPMFRKPTKKDPKFISKITSKEALEYWIQLILEAYERLYKNGKFTTSEVIENWNKEYHEENDSSMAYLETCKLEDFFEKNAREVHEEYETWCEENDVQYSKTMLKNALQTKFGLIVKLIRKNDKVFRAYVKGGNI